MKKILVIIITCALLLANFSMETMAAAQTEQILEENCTVEINTDDSTDENVSDKNIIEERNSDKTSTEENDSNDNSTDEDSTDESKTEEDSTDENSIKENGNEDNNTEKEVRQFEEDKKETSEEVNKDRIANTQLMIDDSITDVNGEIFKIARPNPNAISKVNATQFGLSPERNDNYEAFNSAINYCKEHPNTCLEINKGIYHFRTERDLNLNGLNNILIDGNGSEFVFSTPKYFKINQCNSLELRELAIEWDWESSRLASLVRISKCNKAAKSFEIEFVELDDVDVDIPIICFMQFDKEALIPGSYGGYKTFYPGQVSGGIVKREKVAPNRIKIYCGEENYLNTFHDEEIYLIRHYTYGGRVFQPLESENITFDDIHIYSAAGMGYIVSDKTKYFQIINSSIGRRSDREDAPYISTTADGIHILNTSGYFRIENCDFSFTGDDVMNIHDDVMTFTENEKGIVFKGKVTGTFACPGDKVKFKNPQMGSFDGCEDYEVEVESFDRNAQTNDAIITFKTPVDSAIGKEGFIYRSSTSTSNYVIRNNYIHETKGRGMLLLGSNALIEDNELYRTVSEGIHVLADVDSNGVGSGGYGPSNVIIRGNTLTECTVSDKMPVIMIRYKNGNKISEYSDVLTNIKIESNKFIGCFTSAIEADNVTNLVIQNNLIQDCGKRDSDSSKNIIIGEHCNNVINDGNNITTTSHTSTHRVTLIQGRAPSCVSYGMKPIEYCNDCHRKLTEVIGIKPIAHNLDKKVIVNKVDATCGKSGLYEEVSYCTGCDQEMKRETKEILATGKHDYSKYISNRNGTHKVVCKDCGEVQKGHDKDSCSGGNSTCKVKAKCSKCNAEYGSLAAHKQGIAVKENVVKATSKTPSSYDSVVYCTVCKKEISRKKITGEKLKQEDAPNVSVSYRTHVQTYGWQNFVKNGATSGTYGQSKRLEGINIKVDGNDNLGIIYTTHCQTYGWLPWSANGDMSGTEGEAKRLEAIEMKLTGADKAKYDIYYRVHAQSYGWLAWAKNGEPAGTAGYAKRLEGIQIVVVKKGDTVPNLPMEGVIYSGGKAFYAKDGKSPIVNYPSTSNKNPVIPGENLSTVAYRTHVQSYGWQGWKFNGQMSGTSGEAKRLEGIEIKLNNKQYSGGITYHTHVQSYGWQSWRSDGDMSGTSGESKRLEAIEIKLTGEMAKQYDVYYRVHAQSYGWLAWANNGASAGTVGYGKRLEGIQIVLVKKGASAPGNTYMGISSTNSKAYIEKK